MAQAGLCCFLLCNKCCEDDVDADRRARTKRWQNMTYEQKYATRPERKPLLKRGQRVNVTDAERRAHKSCQGVRKIIQRGGTVMVNKTNPQRVEWVVNMAKYEEEKPIFRRIAKMYFK